jgi:hypothetical protein
MNKDNMKQSKEISFWKPVKITTIKRGIAKPLFDYPNINTKSNYPKTLLNINAPKSFLTPNLKKPVSVINTSTKSINKKNMNWFQAKAKFPKLNPFGDADRDRVINMLDCKPFNKSLQEPRREEFLRDVKIKEKKRIVPLEERERILREAKEEANRLDAKTRKEEYEKFKRVEKEEVHRKREQRLKKRGLLESAYSVGPPAIKTLNSMNKFEPETKIINVGERQSQMVIPKHELKEPVDKSAIKIIQAGLAPLLKVQSENQNDIERLKEDMEKIIKKGRTKRLSNQERQKLIEDKKEIEASKEKERIARRNIEVLKEQGRTARRNLRTEEQLSKTESIRIKAEVKKREEENLRKKQEGKAQVTLVRNIADIVRSSRRRGYRQENWVTGEESLRWYKEERAKLKEPEKIKIDPYERTRIKLREMEEREIQKGVMQKERLEKKERGIKPTVFYGVKGQPLQKMAFITEPEKIKERKERVTGGIIFDVPVKSPIKRFVEKVTGRKTGAVVGEKILTNEYVSLPAIKSQKEKKEEREILIKTRDEELKMAKEEKKKEREERIVEKEEKRTEREEKAEEKKTDEYGTPYEESAQKLIDEA